MKGTWVHKFTGFLDFLNHPVKHDVSETGSVSVLGREGKIPTQLGSLGRANLNHWTTPAKFTQPFIHLRSIRAVAKCKFRKEKEHSKFS
jgi:hypothetical protein